MTKEQLLETIINDGLFKSISQSESLREFFAARQDDMDESEITNEYRKFDREVKKFEECFENFFTDRNGKEKILSNSVYEDKEIHSSHFFYQQGFFEGIKCVLLSMARNLADQDGASAKTQKTPDGPDQTIVTQLITALQNNNLNGSIGQSDSLEGFVVSRTKNFQVAEISAEYRTLEDKRIKFEECLNQFLMGISDQREKDTYPKYAELEFRSNRIFYRRGLFEGVKFLLTVIANILPEPDFFIGDSLLFPILKD